MEQENRTGIRNRDIPLLTRIFYIMQDIMSLQRRSDFQNDLLFSTTKRLTGMPGGGGLPHGFDVIIGELEEMNRDYGDKINDYVRDLRKAEKIINGIPNGAMRTFVRLYYVDQIEKADVMRKMEMTEYQFEKARKAIEDAESMRKAEWPEKFRMEKSEI